MRAYEEMIVKLWTVPLIVSFLFAYPVSVSWGQEGESGELSVYFMEQKVGFEEYTWQSDEIGHVLSVKGWVARPIATEIENLIIRLDKEFRPIRFFFKGLVSGVAQEISSTFVGDQVENRLLISGIEQGNTAKIKSDTFLLPSAVYSPYMIITKKFACSLAEPVVHFAYIIPQLEAIVTLKPLEDSPCSIVLLVSGTEIELETDDDGSLLSLSIPSQMIRVIRQQKANKKGTGPFFINEFQTNEKEEVICPGNISKSMTVFLSAAMYLDLLKRPLKVYLF